MWNFFFWTQQALTRKVGEEDGLGKDGLPDQGHQQEELLGEEQLGRLFDLDPRVLKNLQRDAHAVLALHAAGLIEQQGDEGPRGLDGDEENVDRVRDFSRLVLVDVEANVDGAAEDLARQAVREPVAQRLALVPRLRVRDGDGGLGHPKDARADAAQGGAQQQQPLGAVAAVAVEPRGVGGVAERAKDEGALDANVVHHGARKVARDDHEAKRQRVGRVGQARAGRAARPERVHGRPDARGGKVTQAEDGDVVKGRAVPFNRDSLCCGG